MTEFPDFAAIAPFIGTLEISIECATKDEVVARMPYSVARTTGGGAVNGGALMSLADNMGGVCAYLNLPAGSNTTTISSSTVFLRGVRSGDVVSTTRPLHVGRSTIAVRTEVRDEQGRIVAEVTQTQAVLTG